MRYLVTLMVTVLALSACGPTEKVAPAAATNTVDTTNSATVTSNSNTSSNVSSSTNVGNTTTTTTSSDSSTTSCSTEHNGKRCEVSCSAPQVAQCVKGEGADPTCRCK